MIIMVPSLNYASTYFIFRDHGTEVKVTTTNGVLKSSKPLTNEELQFIKENVLA